MEHESDSESEPASEYVYNAALDLRSHERYSHAAHEHLDFIWLDYNNALDKITYKNAKDLLKKSKEFLNY